MSSAGAHFQQYTLIGCARKATDEPLATAKLSVTVRWSLAVQRFTLVNIMADMLKPAHTGIFYYEPTRHIRLTLH
jgi:hypothetical protein